MSEQDLSPNQAEASTRERLAQLALKQIPYLIVLALTIFGVAYTSVSRQPLSGYWEFLAVLMAAVCIATGWLHEAAKDVRIHIIWTQLLHWAAFIVAMNIVLFSGHAMLSAPAMGLTLLMLLALGTFVAGVHIAWQICVLGILMAAAVPAITWLTETVLFLVLGLVSIIGVWAIFRPRHRTAS